MSGETDTVETKLSYVTRIVGAVRRLLRLERPDWRESIEDALEGASERASDLVTEEQHMMRNLLGFRDVRVADVMVPRADIEALDENIGSDTLVALFVECAHSRMPVYRYTLDHPLGMLHIKDVLPEVLGETSDIDIAKIMRNVLFAPPSMSALELLLRMRASRTHMALVIDEYGGTDGLVTIEDLVEEIVGEIEDEHDDEVDLVDIRDKGNDKWDAHARIEIEEVEAALGVRFNEPELDEVDTLGGLAFTKAGRVPRRGEILFFTLADGRELELLIRDADARRIKFIELRLVPSRDE